MNQAYIAKNIENLRLKNSLKQEDFAKRLNVSRPTVSNWEQGKAVPTTDQLYKIAEEFHVSTDELLGLRQSWKNMVVIDSSVLLRRPRILDEMQTKNIQFICITETVLSELNFQKDKGKRKQQAWLAMKTFNDLKKENADKFKILPEPDSDGINDNRIITAALHAAKADPTLMVYIVAEDIYFPLKAKTEPNLKVLTLSDYESEFPSDENDFDDKDTQNFFRAVQEKDLEAAKEVYKRNPDINHTDAKTGLTPCIQAIRNKDKAMLEWLLSLPETDINKCDDVKYRIPPIVHAVQMNSLDFIRVLVKFGADIDRGSQGRNYGNTALMVASWHGRLEIVKYLVEQGACCNQQDSNGYTPLIKACIQKREEVVEYLFDKTDKSIRSREYMTAKDYALKTRNENIIYKFTKGAKE